MRDGLYWAEKFKNKEIHYSEYLDLLEKKIISTNDSLAALVTFEKEAALKQYQEANLDQTIFGGLPIPLKMLGQSKKGWLATSGSRLFEGQRANTTSHFVSQLENNGLVPVGQTAAPEFGFKNVTDAEIYGHTRNPWNLAHSAGGSSGGAAAAVASGMFPIAAASDGGGSIRIPASFNGLIGLKPTRGTMPVGPSGWRGWQGASISFALTVSMRDTNALFYGMRGTETAAPYQAPAIEWQHNRPSNKKMKIAYSTVSPVASPVSEEAIEAVKNAIDFLIQEGHEVVEITYPVDGANLIRNYYQMNGAETAAMFAAISSALKREVSKEDMELMTWGIYQYGKKLSAANYVQSLQSWDQAAYQMETLFQDYDLFLSPATAYSAPKIETDLQSDEIRLKLHHIEELSVEEAAETVYEMFEKSLTLSPYTQLANLTGQPAISLPTHLTKENLPLGIQFMAAKGREDQLLQIGMEFESKQKFHLPSSFTD